MSNGLLRLPFEQAQFLHPQGTAFADGRLDLPSLREKEDEAIRDAMSRQREIGLDVIADGEMRRHSWLTGMADAVDGFMPDSVMLEWHGPGGGAEKTTARIGRSAARYSSGESRYSGSDDMRVASS